MRMILMLVLLLSVGCETVSITPEHMTEIVAPPVQSANLRNIEFNVITYNSDILITLTTKQYENLALNMQEIKRVMLEQKHVITYYKNKHKDIKE